MATQTNEQDDMPIIRFRDAVGRKFTFPFQMVKDWPVSLLHCPPLHDMNTSIDAYIRAWKS